MKHLMFESMPCWYELSWDKEQVSLVIRVHRVALDHLKLRKDAPIIGFLKDVTDNSPFSGVFTEDFGFGRVLAHKGNRGDFVEFHAKIPAVKVLTENKCPDCRGSKWRKGYADDTCLRCDGSGKAHEWRWVEAYKLSASLTVLFSLIEFLEVDTGSETPQLFSLRTMTQRGQHGGSLSGTFGIELCRWLCSLSADLQIVEMNEAMEQAYTRMFGQGKYYRNYSFRSDLSNGDGWLNVSCPGDACGLNPSRGSIRRGEAYEFSCHNVDTPVQQLTLLAGLAALHDKARREMKV